MTTASPGSQVRDFAKPNETGDFPLGALELLSFGDDVIGRLTVEPGWRWSQSLGPIMGTDMCQAAHFAYCISGTMRITMAGGETFDIGPGQCGYVAPGHDAELVGTEPCVMIDWMGMVNYARRR